MSAVRFESVPQLEMLSHDGEVIVRRGVESATGARVLLVSPASDQPSPATLARMTHEYALRAELDASWAAKPIALSKERRQPVLVRVDPGAELLEASIGAPFETGAFLDLALAITAALRQMHERGVIHRDLKPAHILVDRAAARAWLTGFGHASNNPREQQAPMAADVIAGTFAYMAPEQTGRMNRSVDARSDLYSLGVVFYRMLTGVLPFEASEPLEWVYSHIARQATAPSELFPSIPRALSDLAMKLLAKNAEERYQTAAGLEADLARCREQWRRARAIVPFALAGDDLSARLLIPERLYGREHESAVLRLAFHRVVQTGSAELVMVSGYSGIGKSALVRELMKDVVARRTLFLAGKYDQLNRDVPFATLAQAFGGLIRQILREGEEQVAAWRAAIMEALGRNAQLMIDVIRELEWLIGPQPQVLQLAPAEARNRFQAVFRRFVGACATAEHPLVLFLDDLQWIDPASLGLIELLVTQGDTHHLLLVGAYRDSEVAAAHPLQLALDRVGKTGASVTAIVLKPLAQADLLRLTADAIRAEPAEAQPLAELVFQRTGGNPFFALQLLAALAEERVLRFDHAARAWRWDLGRVGGLGYTDNVIDLMLAKFQRLPGPTLETLKLLACLGMGASRETLALASGKDDEAVARDLGDSLKAGFVTSSAEGYRFVHDRIQEAAYSLISTEARAPMHLAIGRVLLSRLEPGAIDERLFEIVDHMNRAALLLDDAGERDRVARLNVSAGAKAKGAVAYQAARKYFECARALQPADAYATCYDASFALLMELAECEFLCGNLAQADELVDEGVAVAASDLDRARILGLRMRSWQSAGRLRDALAVGLEALALFGQTFPADDEQAQRDYLAEQDAFWAALGERKVADLYDLPTLTDPAAHAVIALLADSGAISYNARPLLTPLIYCRALNLALRHGNSPQMCMLYISYGAFSVARRDLDSSFAFAELAFRLNERFGDARLRGLLYYVLGANINHWRHPLADSLPILEQGVLASQEVGNLGFASFNAAILVSMVRESGETLDEARRIAHRYATFAQEHKSAAIHLWCRTAEQLVANLRGETESPTSLDDAGYSEAGTLALFTQGAFHTGIANLHLTRTLAALFQGCPDAALEAAEACEASVKGIRSTAMEAVHHFLHALAVAAIYPDAPETRRTEFLALLESKLERLRYWNQNAPENNAHRLALVEAELARIQGRELDAMRQYDQSIRAARQHGYVQYEGLANELAARCYRGLGFETAADAYLKAARQCYQRWGARAVVARLERGHPELFAEARALAVRGSETKIEHLDLISVLRASQAVSNDIVLESLVKTLLRIAIEHAGADRGLLLLPNDGEQRIVAEAAAHAGGVEVAVRDAPVHSAELPESVLNYVLRTREKVLIDAARDQNPYSADPHFQSRQPKSLLCLPLLKQGVLVGVLYLENRLTPGAFSDRTEVLELLASQAAISLENATLYANVQREQAAIRELNASLEQRVAERTTALSASEQRANEASQAKSVFLANMSHELRTPLNAVLGFARLLRRGAGLGPGERDSLSIIEKSGEHLLSLINQVLSIAKIEAGSMTLESQPFDLRELLDTIARMFQSRTEEAGLTFLVELDPNIPAAVRGDAGKLRQALINLLGNAIKFTRQGSVSLAVTWQAPRAMFRVSDTGHGIAADELPTLFQPFVQTQSGRGAKEGTGLGLAITRRIVELMGGTITVQSQLGVGTRFCFDAELEPCAPLVNQPQALLVSGLAPGQRAPRIAVVDDAAENRTLLQRLLESVGIEVRCAENGEQALALWRAWAPELVFMDMRMPVMDGREATRRIRAEERGARVAIVALTASVYVAEETALRAEGFDEVIFKPYREERIFAAIAERLGVRFLYAPAGAAVAAPAPAATRRRGASASQARPRILLTDDDPVNLAVAGHLLADLGYDVTEAADGQAALDLLEQDGPFDLMLLDVEMPRMGGIETVRRIRGDRRYDGMRVLAMSAHGDAGDTERFRVAGMDDQVHKPLDPARVAATVARWLRTA